MSFRTRLTTFFVVIVVVPMIAVGALVFRLIGDSRTGKADARAAGLASAAASLYVTQSGQARLDARQVAQRLAPVPAAALPVAVRSLQANTGLARLAVTRDGRTVAAAGTFRAVAPGSATVRASDGARLVVTASTLSARDLVQELTGVAGVEAVVTHGRRIVASSLPSRALPSDLPPQGSVTIAGTEYRTFTGPLPGFGTRLRLTTLSDTRTAGSVAGDRAVAIVAIGAFLLLAFGFAVLSARALERQLRRFLEAARRLAGGDFSEPVPIEGNDEFAALGHEFNRMSAQLEERLAELTRERGRLRESLVRIGETFASGLDRQGIIDLALRTGRDAVEATGGRISSREVVEEPLAQAAADGELSAYRDALLAAERTALTACADAAPGEAVGEAPGEDGVIAVTLGQLNGSERTRGLMSLVRPGRRFDAGERALLGELGSQVARALDNVERHHVVSRAAVTDRLTGLANRGQFSEMLLAALEQARRYHHPVGLIMLDVDNFKRVNDTYGHPQGDVVLTQVADALRANSRDADTPARYGGEEMALILPHTDLEGAFAIAERVRTAIEELVVPRLEGGEPLRVTASLGVAASDGDRDGEELVADADAALYRAKHSGKNRTERALAVAGGRTAGVSGGE